MILKLLRDNLYIKQMLKENNMFYESIQKKMYIETSVGTDKGIQYKNFNCNDINCYTSKFRKRYVTV